MEARQWIKKMEKEYNISDLLEEEMPNVDMIYASGALRVSVEKYDEVTGRMVLGIVFPDELAKVTRLWEHIANCNYDGLKQVEDNPVTVKMLILGPEERGESFNNIFDTWYT